jgi:plastocyanin
MMSPILDRHARRIVSRALLRRAALLTGSCSLLAAAAGCKNDSVAPRSVDASALYWKLALDQHAVTLATAAPYDTLTLRATPQNSAGAPLPELGSVTFTSSDLARLRVSPAGVLQALAPGSGLQVVATLQAGNLTHADTAFVDITPVPPSHPLASLSIRPAPPDSSKLAMAGSFGTTNKQLPVQMLDTWGDPILGLRVDFQSSDPTTAMVDRQTGVVTGIRIGRVLIVASTTAYGVTRDDTLALTIGLPVFYAIRVVSGSDAGATIPTGFTPSEINVGVGATVIWSWAYDLPATDVTFDDPMNVAEDTVGYFGFGARTGGGNIPPPEGCSVTVPFSQVLNCLKARAFPLPGVYHYHSQRTGAMGQVTVVDESTTPSP